MSQERKHTEELFDRAVVAVRDQPIDPLVVDAARERVQRRLAAELDGAAATDVAGAPEHRIRGCDGFRGLIPAYLAGALAEPRRMLFEDHTRECVPCRRALALARRGGVSGASWQSRRRHPAVRYAIAAGLAGLVATGAVLFSGRIGLYGPDASARVRAIEGDLVALDGGAVLAIAAGDELERGETVRTGSGSTAVLELADGSRVELAERSQLQLQRRRDGVVLGLERGALIVEAAERKRGHLYVRTDDCLVSVVGTIFSVNHGVRGSRVSVLDGEVVVDSGAERAVLRPGDQMATTALLGRVALTKEIAWSRNAAQYRERIAALAALGREIDATLAVGGRTSTALLDRAPADAAIWVGLPNVADELSQAWDLIEQRVAENPVLTEWWGEYFADGGNAVKIAEALEHLRVLGSHLGEEIAVAVTVDATGEPREPLVMAEVVDGGGLDALVDAEVARINAEAGAERVRRIDDPSQATGDGVLYLWHSPDGLFAASTSGALLAALGSGSGFAGSALHAELAQIYGGGTGWVVGVDVARILTKATDHAPEGAFDELGLSEASNFLLESESVEGSNETRASLVFAGERRGAAAWLEAPAPSGALEFVSSAASLAIAGISKQPVEMFDDLMAMGHVAAGDRAPAELQQLESELGFSLRDDLAATLGGDAAFALDGPLLPKPSWKVVIEVIDPAGLEYVLERAVEAVNRKAADEGHPGLRFGQEEVDGRRYLTLANGDASVFAVMTFVDGYLVAAPSRALVVEAIAHRAAGTHLAASREFQERLPSDAETDFSALFWQNLGGAAGPLGQLLGSTLPEGGSEQIDALATEIGPLLVLAYGDPDRLRLVARGGSGPLGFSFEKLLAVAGVVGQMMAAPDDDGAATEESETPTRVTA